MGFMKITQQTTDLAKSGRFVGLFSHSEQQRAAQTLTCQYASASNKGAGGRLADALAAGLQKPGRWGGKPMVSQKMIYTCGFSTVFVSL